MRTISQLIDILCRWRRANARKKIELAIELYSMPMNGAFFMIDLDRFKQINETAEILKPVFCEDDIIGRMGGDEFCVFYTGRNRDEILEAKAAKICEEARKILPAREGKAGTSESIGIAKGYGNEEFSELYRRADRALYVQKFQYGKDGYTIYEQLDEENE